MPWLTRPPFFSEKATVDQVRTPFFPEKPSIRYPWHISRRTADGYQVQIPTQKGMWHLMAHYVRNTQLPVGATLALTGTVSFSHIVHKYDGEELEKRIASAPAGSNPTTKPHYSFSIENAQFDPEFCGMSLEDIYAKKLNGGDAANYDPFYYFIYERLEASGTGKKNEKRTYSRDIVGFPPAILHLNEAGQYAYLTDDAGNNVVPNDIANGTQVSLLLKTYQAGTNIGVGIQGIVVKSVDIPWRAASGAAASLGSDFGINVTGEVVAPAATAPSAPAGPGISVTGPDGLPVAPAQSAPSATPSDAPAPAAPQPGVSATPTPSAPAPAAPAAPAPGAPQSGVPAAPNVPTGSAGASPYPAAPTPAAGATPPAQAPTGAPVPPAAAPTPGYAPPAPAAGLNTVSYDG